VINIENEAPQWMLHFLMALKMPYVLVVESLNKSIIGGLKVNINNNRVIPTKIRIEFAG
jgi:hypothetical protein